VFLLKSLKILKYLCALHKGGFVTKNSPEFKNCFEGLVEVEEIIDCLTFI
jgi:hypothetical protein